MVARIFLPYVIVVASSFVLLSTNVYPENRVAETDPVYIDVSNVYGRLIDAIGDGRTAPSLTILQDSSQIAVFIPIGPKFPVARIEIGKKLVDLCNSLDSGAGDAAAFILGHELAHFYKDHGWIAEYGVSIPVVLP